MAVNVPALFAQVAVDPETLEQIRGRPLPRKRLVIFFTPRSGSSWLTEVLAQTVRLGRAIEAFNPNFIPKIAQSCMARSLPDYVDLMQRRLNTRGTMSFEITWHQLRAVFGDDASFLAHFAGARNAWLIREDIVAQAVSLAKMVTTKVAHSPQATPEDRARAEQAFVYDPALIRHWLSHILAAERETEAHFARQAIVPLRMCYEDMMAAGAEAAAARVARFMSVADVPPVAQKPSHSKLGTSQNDDYAARFRADENAFLTRVAEERAPWIAAFRKQREAGDPPPLRVPAAPGGPRPNRRRRVRPEA